MDTKECREAFEAWAKTQGTKSQGWWFRQLPDGGYSANLPDLAWKAWQAAWNRRADAQEAGLTDADISEIWEAHIVPVFGKNGINPIVFARAILAALARNAGKDAADAKRYRWLRDNANVTLDPSENVQMVVTEPVTLDDWKADFDRIVDASIAGEKKE